MNFSLKDYKKSEIIFYIWGILLFFDPKSKILKINELLFILLLFLIFYFLFKQNKITKKAYVFIILYTILPFFYGLLIALVQGEEISDYWIYQGFIKIISSLSIFIFLHFNIKEKLLQTIKILKCYSFLYSLIVILFWILKLRGDEANFFIYKDWLYEKELFWMHFWDIGVFGTSALMLLFLQSFLLFKTKDKKILILSIFLLIQSTTAANTLSSLLILGYFILTKILKKMSLKARMAIFLLSSIFFIMVLSPIVFSSSDTGNTIKYFHLISYIDLWKENPLKFLLGSGLGSSFFSKGLSKIVHLTEIAYLDIIRVYGLIVGGGVILIISYPLIKLFNEEDNWLFISYLAYIFISFTNPYIVSYQGTIVVCWIYAYVFLKDKFK